MSGRGHPPARSLDRLPDGSSGHDLDLPWQPDAAAERPSPPLVHSPAMIDGIAVASASGPTNASTSRPSGPRVRRGRIDPSGPTRSRRSAYVNTSLSWSRYRSLRHKPAVASPSSVSSNNRTAPRGSAPRPTSGRSSMERSSTAVRHSSGKAFGALERGLASAGDRRAALAAERQQPDR